MRDMANILSPEVEAALQQRLDDAQEQWGPQMAVVTVETLHGYTIEEFSLEYARSWGLGDAQRNDGLLLLVAPSERKLRIEVGKGIERTFTDVYCQQVIATMIPYFSSGDFDGGVSAGVDEMVGQMRRHPTAPANDNPIPAREKAA